MSLDFNSLKDILFIDIETVSQEKDFSLLSDRLKILWKHKAAHYENQYSPEESYFHKAGIYAEFGKVIAIGIGFFYLNNNAELLFKVKCLSNKDERILLNEFIHFLEMKCKNRRIIFCAHNGKEFDYPFLCRRMLVNSLDIPKVLNARGKKPWEVEHLDTLELWKFGDRKNFTSLELLAALFDIPGSKSDLDGSKVGHVYHLENNLERIAHYCREDVLVTAQIYLRLHNKPLINNNSILKI